MDNKGDNNDDKYDYINIGKDVDNSDDSDEDDDSKEG